MHGAEMAAVEDCTPGWGGTQGFPTMPTLGAALKVVLSDYFICLK